MAIYKCAPASVVNATAEMDARLLSTTHESLPEQALYLFSATPETSSIIVNTDQAGCSVYDWYTAQDEKTLGTKAKAYSDIPFEAEKIGAPEGGSVIINNQNNEAVIYTLKSSEDGSLYFNKTNALDAKDTEGDLSGNEWKSDFLAWESRPGSVFSLEPGITLVLEYPAFVIMFSSAEKGNGSEPMIADAGKSFYIKDGQAKFSLLGYTSVFEIDQCVLDGSVIMTSDDQSYQVLLFLEGDAVVSQSEETIHVQPGSVVLVPANEDRISITGNGVFAAMKLL